jgi:hypothetical protein
MSIPIDSAILDFTIWKNPFSTECLAFVLAHRKASGTRLILLHAIPAATRDLDLYGVIRGTGTHVPQQEVRTIKS